MRLRVVPIVGALLLSLRAASAVAHPAPYSYVDLRLDGARLHGAIVVHAFDVAAELGEASPEEAIDSARAELNGRRLGAILAPRITLSADGAPVSLRWTTVTPLADRHSLQLSFDTDVDAARQTSRSPRCRSPTMRSTRSS